MADLTTYVVAFEHTGADGKVRHPGDAVELDPAEAATRLQDGFIRPADPEWTEKPAAKRGRQSE